MKLQLAELATAVVVLVAVCGPEGREAWAMLAKACQVTAAGIGRVGLYAEARATVLMAERA